MKSAAACRNVFAAPAVLFDESTCCRSVKLFQQNKNRLIRLNPAAALQVITSCVLIENG